MSTALEVLRAHTIKRAGGEPEGLDIVLSHFKPMSLKRGDVLLRQGEVCTAAYFVAKGCLQVYATDADGNETTRDIGLEEAWISELISFGSGQPAVESIRAVEPTEVCAMSRDSFGQMMAQVPSFERIHGQIVEALYANSVYRIHTFMGMTALERIEWLMTNRPTLLTRLPSRLVASYLGIAPEVLSRLRAKLRKA